MHNDCWENHLVDAYEKSAVGGRARIRLPESGLLNFGGTRARLELELSEEAATISNMQDDAGAFDAWLLVIRHYLGVKDFYIEMMADQRLNTPHGGRTLFRLQKLERLLGGELKIGPRLAAAMAEHDWTGKPGSKVFLNVAKKGRDRRLPDEAKLATESDIELALCYHPTLSAALAKAYDLLPRGQTLEAEPRWALCRQFPTGVFKDDPNARGTEKVRYSPGGKSAIDLVGVDRDGAFHVFEIKKPGPKKVGALSELLFYTNLMDEARGEGVKFSPGGKPDHHARVTWQDVKAASSIKGHLLVPDIHPLLRPELFQEINDLAAKAGLQVSLDVDRMSEKIPAIEAHWAKPVARH